MRRWVLILIFALPGTQLGAQAFFHPATEGTSPGASDPTSSSQPRAQSPAMSFRTGVDLVALNVVVTDQQQKLVTGLTANDFRVFEDGVQQDLSFFAASELPLDLAIVLDTSASMTDKMHTMQEAAVGFASSLRPGDRLSIMGIKDSATTLHSLDGNFAAAREAILQTTAKGGTALYNGLYLALKDMMKESRINAEVRRQAIAIFSDGDDTASLVSFDDVMEVAKESGIAVYTILLRSPFANRLGLQSAHHYFSDAEFTMKALAQETGARSFFPSDISELAGVYRVISEELASQYALGYTPKNIQRDGKYRRIIVQLADKPGMRTRTRTGYLSARADRAALPQPATIR